MGAYASESSFRLLGSVGKFQQIYRYVEFPMLLGLYKVMGTSDLVQMRESLAIMIREGYLQSIVPSSDRVMTRVVLRRARASRTLCIILQVMMSRASPKC